MAVYSGASTPQGGNISQGEISAFTQEIWIPTLMRYLVRKLNLVRYTDRMTGFEGKKGTEVRKPYIGRLRTRRKTAGDPLQFEQKREGEWKMIVDKYSYAAFAIDGRVEYDTEVDLARAYAPEIAQALMEDLEYELLAHRAVYQAYNWESGQKITSASPIAYADILSGFEYMLERGYNVNDLVLQVGPRQLVTMFNIDEFTQSGTYNSGDVADIKSGTIVGDIMGINVELNQFIRANAVDQIKLGGDDYEDPNAEVTPTPGMLGSMYLPTQYGSDQRPIADITAGYLEAGYHSAMLIPKQFAAFVMKKNPSLEMWWNPDYQETRVASTQIFDSKVIDPRRGVVINTTE
jgi:hypothetical protein